MNQHFQHINTSRIEELAAGDTEFYIEIIDIFLNQIPDFIDKMTTALEEKNWQLLAREAHTAKSSALTFGMEDTGVRLKQVQLLAEANELDTLPELVKKAISDLEAAIPELHELKNSL
ncbi:Hpt domain-containing protein [Maribellus sp. YY47]|uniref:Hpt domain-containing protein n=1 Tax=Maribellus sp. YY47 TaxID=2929486 RepID=UPI002000CB14|nr:Hpt domain-containing protein [Maribellus sp. YY47]MCK3685632.1 Hpt domain-containing protein [Maribellus sp. YY47]